MKSRDKSTLLDNLEHYGYGLLRPAAADPPERVLKDLVSQNDARLLEGFPVVLYNGLKSSSALMWERGGGPPKEKFSKEEGKRFSVLLALSFLLFKLFGVDEEYVKRTEKLLSKFPGAAAQLKQLTEPFMKSESVEINGATLSIERLKRNFRNYVLESVGSKAVSEKVHELELEMLLSELFTARQKELLKKRLAGQVMTKTEREYFYRVVKKRLKALASEELHQLARKLVS